MIAVCRNCTERLKSPSDRACQNKSVCNIRLADSDRLYLNLSQLDFAVNTVTQIVVTVQFVAVIQPVLNGQEKQ